MTGSSLLAYMRLTQTGRPRPRAGPAQRMRSQGLMMQMWMMTS